MAAKPAITKVDFGIITVREDEFEAVLQRFPNSENRAPNDHGYVVCQITNKQGMPCSVAITRSIEQGQNEAQNVARNMIEDVHPDWILLTGIAGGVPDGDYSLGDVLVASRLHDFSISAILQDGQQQFNTGGGPMHHKAKPLLSIMQAYAKQELAGWNVLDAIGCSLPKIEIPDSLKARCYYGNDDWKRKVQEYLRRKFPPGAQPRDPVVRVGAIASSNTLVKNTKLVQQWLQSARADKHVEMELGGVYIAAQEKNVPILSIRGISDIIGFRRNEDWTAYACHVAAAFTYRLILSGILQKKNGKKSPVTSPGRPAGNLPEKQNIAPAPMPQRLPARPAHCFGRDGERERLVLHLLGDSPQPVPILGPAGIGKSTLTLAALHDERVADYFGTRRFFIRCDAVLDRAALAAELARALGLPLSPDNEDAALRALAAASAVLALDNFETPWEAGQTPAEELLGLLGGVPGLALVVSLRGAARPDGLDWNVPIELRALDLPAARQAFLAIAGQEFAADPHLDRLCRAVDRVPLALMLLAHAAQGEPDLSDLWARWQTERTAMLQRGEGRDRLTNIEISYKISIHGKRMTNDGRRLLFLLGQLPGGLARADVDPLLPGVGRAAATVLSQTGLAYYDEAIRLRLLAPLREYVSKRYPAQPEDLDRAIQHYLALARRGKEVGRKDGAQAAIQLAPDTVNIERMLEVALDGPRAGEAVKAAHAWAEFVRFTGAGSERPIIAAAERARKAGAVLGETNCIFSLGLIALQRSDHAGARKYYEQALLLSRQVGDVQGGANCIQSLGDIALRHSDHVGARKHYEQALPLYRQVGDMLGEANCIWSLGDIAFRRSDHTGARKHYEQALLLFRQVGDVLGEANCIKGLGNIALRRSEHAGARKHYEQALPLFQQVGDMLGEANCIRSLGDIALRRSDHAGARAQYEQALPLYRQVGAVLGEANCIKGLGDIALAFSDHTGARERYEQARPLYRQVSNMLGEANCIKGLGDIAQVLSDHAGARGQYEQALALYERILEPYSIGMTHRLLAQIAEDPATRQAHVLAARAACLSIDRPDLVAQLDAEFGTADAG